MTDMDEASKTLLLLRSGSHHTSDTQNFYPSIVLFTFTMKSSAFAQLVALFAGIVASQASLPVIQVSENEESIERDPSSDVRKQSNIYTRLHLVHNKEHDQVDAPKQKVVHGDPSTTTAVE
jgi:hypothetical protein